MTRITLFTRGTSAFALIAISAMPVAAFPGKADRARTAIAEAQAKLDAADKVGVSGAVPAQLARAQAALATARENLSNGNKEEAIANATHASEFADAAIGEAHKRQTEAMAAQREDNNATTAAARQAVDSANQRTDAARQSAAAASAQAAVATAQADALRNAPPPAPAPTTTVTVEKDVKSTKTPVHHVTHRVAHTQSSPTVSEKTTTTVSSSPSSSN